MIIRASDYYTRIIRQFYKHQTIVPASSKFPGIRPLYKHQPISQASDPCTSIRPFYKHQAIIQASDYYTSIGLSYRHQIILLDDPCARPQTVIFSTIWACWLGWLAWLTGLAGWLGWLGWQRPKFLICWPCLSICTAFQQTTAHFTVCFDSQNHQVP